MLDGGVRARGWRLFRELALPLTSRLSPRPTAQAAYRGYRLTDAELTRGMADAGLRVVARDEAAESPYRFSREVFLRVCR